MSPQRPPPLPSAALLFEHLADAVYLIDPASSNVIWGNRAAWESLGIRREDVLNHSVLSLQKDVTGAPQWQLIADAIRAAGCFNFVGRHRHAAGHELAVEVYTTHFHDQGREYFLSVARDVTRRLALEADLRKRENQLWFALNEASDGLWDWNVTSGEVFFSPQLKRMLGYGPDEMAPRLATWSDNIHPDDAAAVQQALKSHLAGQLLRYEAEYRLRNRNGDWLWVHDRGRVCERDAQGEPTRVVGMVHDITARRAAQAELERHRHHLQELVDERTAALVLARDAAETANQAKSRFLAHMSHELRTPIAAILGLIELTQQQVEDPALKSRLGQAATVSQHLRSMIVDILDLSKIEADRLELETIEFRLGEVVSTAAEWTRPRAEEKGLALQVALPADLARRSLQGDPLRLKQVLLNLLGNAVKFTEAGEVALTVRCEAESAERLQLHFEVRDTGIGIDPAMRERLFMPFEQADSSTTRRYGGTGLGLAICERLVRLMGGTMHADGEPGRGSCFGFTVPLRPASRGSPSLQQLPRDAEGMREKLRQRGPLRVLLAEDDPVYREVLLWMLRNADLQVDMTTDGQEAVQHSLLTRYDLILMDIRMPTLSGLEASRQIRAGVLNGRTPIVALTANMFAEDRQASLDAGMNQHLGKPTTTAELYATMLALLDAR